MNGGLISLSIPYLYLLHVLAISIRVGSTLLFAPIWGFPGLPQYLRVLLVFSIAAGLAVVIPFNVQAVMNRIFEVAQKGESLASAFRKLTARNLSIIPVVEDQRLIGIVTLQNLMHSMALLAESRKLRKQALNS